MFRFLLEFISFSAFILILAGCNIGSGRVSQPSFNSNSGTDAIEAYDRDGDGALSDVELDQVPAIREGLGQIDTNGDGLVTAQEIDARVQVWRDSRLGELPVSCTVFLNGARLANAEVTFKPESFLGANLKPAGGNTGPDGLAGISMASEHLSDPRFPGMTCGWYKVKISSPKKKIPEKYNTETILGCEVALDASWVGQDNLQFRLKSK